MGKPEPFRWSPAEAPPQIQAHSKAKLALVRSYLAKYIRRLGGERRRDIFKLDVVDGFAGGGTFTDGTTEISGSPIIMLEEAAKAETELNLDRAKPLIFDFAYYFVDKNQDHTNHLKNVLRKRQHDDSERVFILTEEFSAACPKVIAAIKKRQPRAGRSIFLLDQFGWKDVPLGVMATIFEQLPTAEIILTISAGAMVNFLHRNPHLPQSAAALKGLTRAQIEDLIEAKGQAGGRGIAQRLLRDIIRTAVRAPFDAPFYVRPEKSHRAIWLLHLSAARHRAGRHDPVSLGTLQRIRTLRGRDPEYPGLGRCCKPARPSDIRVWPRRTAAR